MEKYKYRSTVYLVFLLVSLFINAFLLYMLMFESNPKNTQELEKKADKVYESAFNIITKEKNNFYTASTFKSSEYPNSACYLVDFSGLDQYFTSKALAYLKEDLIISNNNYYDCNKVLSTKLFADLFNKNWSIEHLKYVSYDNETLVVKAEFESDLALANTKYYYLILKLEKEKMLIDSFE